MEIEWIDGFIIKVSARDDQVTLSANRKGLLSLAKQLMTLSQEPAGSHIHYDTNNSLKEGSAELVIEKMPANCPMQNRENYPAIMQEYEKVR